jgi:hypothetical protein
MDYRHPRKRTGGGVTRTWRWHFTARRTPVVSKTQRSTGTQEIPVAVRLQQNVSGDEQHDCQSLLGAIQPARWRSLLQCMDSAKMIRQAMQVTQQRGNGSPRAQTSPSVMRRRSIFVRTLYISLSSVLRRDGKPPSLTTGVVIISTGKYYIQRW